jgi:hypothetical protein
MLTNNGDFWLKYDQYNNRLYGTPQTSDIILVSERYFQIFTIYVRV